VFTEKKLDEIHARLEIPQMPCTGDRTSKLSAQSDTKLLKLKALKTTAVHELEPCDPRNRMNVCNWILWPGHNGGIDPHLLLWNKLIFIFVVFNL
jgi:hypothetical protein